MTDAGRRRMRCGACQWTCRRRAAATGPPHFGHGAQIGPKLPAGPLLDRFAGMTTTALGALLGYHGTPNRAVLRARAEGLHPYLADAWCTRLGLHGEAVWGAAWGDAWEALDVEGEAVPA